MSPKELQTVKQRYGIVGNCDALNRALETSLKVARVDFSILIQGENGVGKEVLPRIIHDASARKGKKYLALNCGALPEGTIDSELFGHVKGAFTGSVDSREGYFSAADGGTLFLDEVGELPLQTQVRLLRVLETGEFIPVGSSEVKRSNVRIVAATNVNMRKAISEGKFREDLFYRLNTIPIQMPPLRDRGGDIVLLFRLFAMQMAEKYHLPKITLTEEARQILLQYKWPGNVRQLKNITEQMSVLSEKREIDADTLLRFIPRDQDSTELSTVQGNGTHTYESEREILYKILYELRGNVSDLRRDLNNVRKQLEESRQLNGAAGFQPAAPAVSNLPVAANKQTINPPAAISQVEDAEAEEISEPETLNLNDIGKQLVEKALERNNGNRKKAAQELGISDRTLYRRIRQYGLDKD